MRRSSSALLVHNHKLLLHLRDNNHPNMLLREKCGLVGGATEKGENPITAARREIKEETNLEPKELKYLGKIQITDTVGEVEASLFFAELSDNEVKSLKLGNEGLDVRFFNSKEIMNLPLSPELRKYYQKHQKVIDSFINDGVNPKIVNW